MALIELDTSGMDQTRERTLASLASAGADWEGVLFAASAYDIWLESEEDMNGEGERDGILCLFENDTFISSNFLPCDSVFSTTFSPSCHLNPCVFRITQKKNG